ncbi:hypothetical protein NLJ89_g1823 [Agrocybe chaxingu]|uniref:Uncharacterized protein n=1 Tax=Agrocybe chaxingu TaxID=84603 RepID=A0A9W8MZB1_9AGAR|nr:hypothetical protein NLJ89_g1823 [Agrocybe chaxingu]
MQKASSTSSSNNQSSLRPEQTSFHVSSFPQPPSRRSGSLLRAGDDSSPSIQVTPSPTSPTSVMYPAPYRSSYMANKKSSTYGEGLSAGGRRKLGNHLPRIASGDADDSWVADQTAPKTTEDSPARRTDRSRLRARRTEALMRGPRLTPSGVLTGDGVAGLPGRIPLKAPNTLPAPSPSSRLLGGSWADKQRHLLQAYEYLCHVGEAQQWIEGCLGEELEIGVIELEDGLQNGVVLAKLVRIFQGEAVVKKIYEGGSKRDFRHSENINHFFRFVREVGLPEGFIFELTDLYEKKNLPKVIYCIHALSHLLARRGLAQRIGNLLGQLHFSDDQLQQTQKGLKEAGVTMPNFGNVGRELAKEINEPEAEIETEDERRDRMLLERVDSIIALQTRLRGFLTRRDLAQLKARMHLAERQVVKLQARLKGVLVRRRLATRRRQQASMIPWVIALQARARGVLLRGRWRDRLRALKAATSSVIKVQAQIRGVLQRRRYIRLKAALRKMSFPTKRLQAAARGHIVRRDQTELVKSFIIPKIGLSVVALQAHARGVLARRRMAKLLRLLGRIEPTVITLQAHCRGLIMRRRLRSQLAKLENVTDIVVGIQAAVRTYLARKRLLALIRGLRKATSVIVGFQARARANLLRQKHHAVNKALQDVKTIKAVGRLQALARASITRNRHRELDKKLEVATPDVVGLQSTVRGALVRSEFFAWRDHLRRSHSVATLLQAMLRGAMQRRAFRKKMEYFRANLSKVVKIQSLFRAKETREQYRQLTLGKNVTVGTIKNFVHLLDDSEADFQEEIKVERLRKRVVEQIHDNQALESHINDLDKRIGLVVHNLKSFEDILKASKRRGDSAALRAARVSLLAAHGDPFSGPHTLDQDGRRKLELYQQLFYLLQTRPEYLTGLLSHLSKDDTSEANRRFMERVVLTLFGYGQDRREDFLLLKLFQLAIRDEVLTSSSLSAIPSGHPLYVSIAVNYVRSRQVTYVRDAFQAIIRELINTDDLDLEADPSAIHRARIDIEEMRSGKPLPTPKDVPFREAVTDPDTRAIYIRHLQVLQWWTEAFLNAIEQSTKKMSYSMRYLAREMLFALREKFPGVPEQSYGTCIGRLVFHRYINPVLLAPEAYDIVPKTMNIATAKKNLAQISRVLAQIVSGTEFGDNDPSYVPINDFVHKAIQQMSHWYNQVASVPDAEVHFHAHEFMDATVQPKPIYISPNEIYSIHSLLLQHQSSSLGPERDDTLKVILHDLEGVPHLDNEELKDARDTPIFLELTNRFAYVQDPHAEEKTLWVQAKRGVLAILRVQPAQDLLESLMRPVTENDEILWEEILDAEIENEMRQIPRRQPSTVANDSAYRLEDIRSLKFAAVKALAISHLLELEKQGKVTREDGFQGILNAIAGDVRSKHRKRLQRQQEMTSMNEALHELAERKKYFEEQLDSYRVVVETAMNTMQRGKGEILLSVDQYSPRQFDKLQITMSSNQAGVFQLLLESTLLGVPARIASQEVRMEDLLQAKYEKRSSLSLFDGKVQVNFDLFLFQINKKFYA